MAEMTKASAQQNKDSSLLNSFVSRGFDLSTYIQTLTPEKIFQFGQQLAKADDTNLDDVEVVEQIMKRLPDIAKQQSPNAQQLALTIINQCPPDRQFLPYVIDAALASSEVLEKVLTPVTWYNWLWDKFKSLFGGTKSQKDHWNAFFSGQDIKRFTKQDLQKAGLSSIFDPRPWYNKPWWPDYTNIPDEDVKSPAAFTTPVKSQDPTEEAGHAEFTPQSPDSFLGPAYKKGKRLYHIIPNSPESPESMASYRGSPPPVESPRSPSQVGSPSPGSPHLSDVGSSPTPPSPVESPRSPTPDKSIKGEGVCRDVSNSGSDGSRRQKESPVRRSLFFATAVGAGSRAEEDVTSLVGAPSAS